VLAGSAQAELMPANVLVVFNSRNQESLAVQQAYIAARPGVLSVDLASDALNIGSVTRAQYLALIRDPVRNFVNGVTTGIDRSRSIIAIATTRGLPARILSPAGLGDEFTTQSAWASVESELTLLQQDLESAGSPELPNRYNGFIANPARGLVGVPFDSIPRDNILIQRPFVSILLSDQGDAAWEIPSLTAGDIYLVCRLDSAAGFSPATTAAVQNIQSLIARSGALSVDRCGVQALVDEWDAPPPPPVSSGFELDDGAVPPLFIGGSDFENSTGVLRSLGIRTTQDENFNFVSGPELADQMRPLLVLGTYGTNHNAFGAWGAPADGGVNYIQSYSVHPAAIFVAYESWNGTSIYAPGTSRGGQQQALDFIARGGSFTVANVMEPFTIAVARLETLLPNLLAANLTFAEAAYAALPTISWQSIPVGDPLARVTLTGGAPLDRNSDGRIDAEDLYSAHAAPQDTDCDGAVTPADAALVRGTVRRRELGDMFRSAW
jgi:hypothetical protein